MGLRLILIIIAIWVVYSLIKRGMRLNADQQNRQKNDTNEAEDMVRCEHCGTHLPLSEALQKDGRHYCCQEHLKADDASRQQQ